MGSKTRLSSYCSEQGDNTVNLVTSRKRETCASYYIKMELSLLINILI